MSEDLQKIVQNFLKDPYISDLNSKARNLEIGPRHASDKIREYLLTKDNKFSLPEVVKRIAVWQEITRDYHILSESYAMAHGLSGRLTV